MQTLNALGEGALYMGGSVILCSLLLVIVRRLPHAKRFQGNNEVAALAVSILGTLYTIVLAFMLFAAWNRFELAKSVTEHESGELLATYRLARGMPDTHRVEIQTLLHDYTEMVVTEEWDAMNGRKEGRQTGEITEKLWTLLTNIEPTTENDKVIYDQMLSHFVSLVQARENRLVLAQSGLPPALWIMMLIGGVVTVLAICLYWVERLDIHLTNVIGLTFMIALVLYTTKLIDNPFQGVVSVRPEALESVLHYMDVMGNGKAYVPTMKAAEGKKTPVGGAK